MDPELVSDLVSGLVCLVSLAPFCLGGLALVACGALLVWVVRRQWQPKDETALIAEGETMRAQLDRVAADLRPWSPAALTDLSTDWDVHWTRFGRDLNGRGTIPSLIQPQGPAWVAFAFKVRGARRPTGQMQARTTAQAFDYRLSQEGIDVLVDGASLGRVQPDGTLLDASSQPIGRAARPGGWPAMFRLGSVAHLRDQRERTYPVVLGDRMVAHLSNPPAQMINAVSLKKYQFPPAVTLEDVPSEEEAAWVLALAILQVAFYNVLETVWTN